MVHNGGRKATRVLLARESLKTILNFANIAVRHARDYFRSNEILCKFLLALSRHIYEL